MFKNPEEGSGLWKWLCLQPHHPQDACVGEVEKDQEGQEGYQEAAANNPSLSAVKLKRIISNYTVKSGNFDIVFAENNFFLNILLR